MPAEAHFGEFDVIVIGGGPGGSTAATLIAKDAHRVLLVEREKFPRYQIGESLLPHTLGICQILGVGEEVDRAGFTPKNGGVWYWGTQGKPGWGFNFGELPNAPMYGGAYAYQVERIRFDEILLRNAQRCGVVVREQCRVEDLIEQEGRIVGVRGTDARGEHYSARARYVVDAGGHSSPFYARVGERIYAEQFRNMAIFCYFLGGKRLPAPQSGSILNVTFDKGWIWYIPLSDKLTSVGAVISVKHAKQIKTDLGAAIASFIDSCPMIRDYLADATRVTEGAYGQYRVRRDWSYCNTRFWRPGLVLVGDSACFVDPLFSSGVHLSTYSALLAARSINTILRNDLDEEQCFREFDLRYRLEYLSFFEFLTTFYDTHLDKEHYFRKAREIVGTDETDREAFVRLVSGLSQQARVAIRSHKGNREFGDSDIADMVSPSENGKFPKTIATGLVASANGLRWSLGGPAPQVLASPNWHSAIRTINDR
jgi:halogenation protein CepH